MLRPSQVFQSHPGNDLSPGCHMPDLAIVVATRENAPENLAERLPGNGHRTFWIYQSGLRAEETARVLGAVVNSEDKPAELVIPLYPATIRKVMVPEIIS